MDLMLNLSMDPLPKKKPFPKVLKEQKFQLGDDISFDKSSQLKPLSNINNKDNIAKKLKTPESHNNNTNKQIENDKSKSDDNKLVIQRDKSINNKKLHIKTNNNQIDDKTKKMKSTLDLDEDANIKDMEKFLSSTKGVNAEPVFSDKSFEKFTELHPHLIKTLSDRMQIKISTAIQEKAIPALLDGKDVLIKSATGSGKTLSYAIPLINSLQAIEPPISRESGIYAIIISPTRELAVQTQDVLTKLSNPFVRIVTGMLIGGVKMQIQKKALRKGLNILISTPNRLLYHMQKTEGLKLHNLQWLIIDEADRITELGYAENVRHIMEQIGKQCKLESLQTVLLSATLTKGVENLAGLALKSPIRAEVEYVKNKTTENEIVNETVDSFSMPIGLQHYLLVCPTKLRMVALLSFLLLKCKYGKQTGKVVVFMSTQDLVEFHYQLFHVFLRNKSLLQELPNTEATQIDKLSSSSSSSSSSNIDIFQLHGGMEHDKRQSVFKNFSACSTGFLLTTDVCSRGLDMTGINWVIQYHPPGNPIDYIHRVGRTARAGSKGKALLFLQPAEVNYINHLQTSVGGLNIEKVSLRSVMKTALHHAGNLDTRKSVHTIEESIFLTAKLLENHVSSDTILQNLARSAYKSLVRSYTCFSREMRLFFCYKDLHLGHVAKSMACLETPKEISRNCVRNPDEEISIDKMKKLETTNGKRKTKERSEGNNVSKKPKLDQAHRNMLAEFGL